MQIPNLDYNLSARGLCIARLSGNNCISAYCLVQTVSRRYDNVLNFCQSSYVKSAVGRFHTLAEIIDIVHCAPNFWILPWITIQSLSRWKQKPNSELSYEQYPILNTLWYVYVTDSGYFPSVFSSVYSSWRKRQTRSFLQWLLKTIYCPRSVV